jgi:hypothetical protein
MRRTISTSHPVSGEPGGRVLSNRMYGPQHPNSRIACTALMSLDVQTLDDCICGSTICIETRSRYNGAMESRSPGTIRKGLRRAKNFLLLLLFLLVPFAGAFHPRIRKREDRDEKEIGDKV